jgi:hypothetical protein
VCWRRKSEYKKHRTRSVNEPAQNRRANEESVVCVCVWCWEFSLSLSLSLLCSVVLCSLAQRSLNLDRGPLGVGLARVRAEFKAPFSVLSQQPTLRSSNWIDAGNASRFLELLRHLAELFHAISFSSHHGSP